MLPLSGFSFPIKARNEKQKTERRCRKRPEDEGTSNAEGSKKKKNLFRTDSTACISALANSILASDRRRLQHRGQSPPRCTPSRVLNVELVMPIVARANPYAASERRTAPPSLVSPGEKQRWENTSCNLAVHALRERGARPPRIRQRTDKTNTMPRMNPGSSLTNICIS